MCIYGNDTCPQTKQNFPPKGTETNKRNVRFAKINVNQFLDIQTKMYINLDMVFR